MREELVSDYMLRNWEIEKMGWIGFRSEQSDLTLFSVKWQLARNLDKKNVSAAEVRS